MSFTDEEMDTEAQVHMDSINIAVGCDHYVSRHRFSGLYLNTPVGRSGQFSVSRYYWDMEHPVVVDFVRDLTLGKHELGVKKRYFREHNIRYILVKDAWDGEGAESALMAYQPEHEQIQAIQNASKPLIGPSRRKP